MKKPYGIFAKCHGHIPIDHYYTVTGPLCQTELLNYFFFVQQLTHIDISVMTPVNMKLLRFQACIQGTCNSDSSKLQQCLCIALGNYAKACASLGVLVGDWRKVTNCCEFNFDIHLFSHFIVQRPMERVSGLMFKSLKNTSGPKS